ncbi:MAG: hypothetical protein MJ180_01910 [Candidatus Gastranaerophilales bacterium]|nr:hypothetical protein [Candidatus Gastranaerophilales bacterium]
MQVNNISSQNFNGIITPSNMPKPIKKWLHTVVLPNIDTMLVNKMEEAGYHINLYPVYYKRADKAVPQLLSLNVIDNFGGKSALRGIAADPKLKSPIKTLVRKWNNRMCKYFGIKNK